MLALVAVWRLTPLRTLLDVTAWPRSAGGCSGHPAAPFAVLAAYLVGTLVFFPITLLLGGTALLFPAPIAIAYCMAGALSAAATTYGIGRLVGTLSPALAASARACSASAGSCAGAGCSRSSRRGCCRSATSRSSTSRPGRSAIRFRDYLIGNAIGLLPGVLALTVFADRIGATVRHPHAANLIVLALVAGAIGACAAGG